MSRNKKLRECQKFEGPKLFKPVGLPLSQLPVTDVDLDELEAMRLCDREGLDQTQAAERMKVSRGTIQRLLYSGRKKIVDSLLTSRAISIETGPHIKEMEERPGHGRGRGRGRGSPPDR